MRDHGPLAVAPEVFNCSAPDTGNMEVLVRYGTSEQKQRWLQPLLGGRNPFLFCMTEPDIASSDATNIRASIVRDGERIRHQRPQVVVLRGGRSALQDRDLHGQDRSLGAALQAAIHDSGAARQPGVKIERMLKVFGYDHAPHGHAEITFENVRVPVSNMLARRRQRIRDRARPPGSGAHPPLHALIGVAERALEMMCGRVPARVAFGKPIAEQGTIRADIAKSRMEIEQARLLTLKAAVHDGHGRETRRREPKSP